LAVASLPTGRATRFGVGSDWNEILAAFEAGYASLRLTVALGLALSFNAALISGIPAHGRAENLVGVMRRASYSAAAGKTDYPMIVSKRRSAPITRVRVLSHRLGFRAANA
jgi:hypothetical protein